MKFRTLQDTGERLEDKDIGCKGCARARNIHSKKIDNGGLIWNSTPSGGMIITADGSNAKIEILGCTKHINTFLRSIESKGMEITRND